MSLDVSARADSAEQLSVEDCLVSARADRQARAVALVLAAASRLEAAEGARARALLERDEALIAANIAGVSVRRLAAAAGIGKTKVADIVRPPR